MDVDLGPDPYTVLFMYVVFPVLVKLPRPRAVEAHPGIARLTAEPYSLTSLTLEAGRLTLE
jgi:hypothetical protein